MIGAIPVADRTSPTLADTLPASTNETVRPAQSSPLPLKTKLKMRAWRLIQATLFRWSPTWLNGWRRLLLRCFGARLAPTAAIRNTARIDCPWNLEMGPHASVGEHAWVYTLDRIVIGEYACVGQYVKLITGSHDVHDPTFPLTTEPIVIGYGCWIAVGAIVLPGVKIGALTVVGAGSVVTRDLP